MRIVRRYHLCAFVDSVCLGVALSYAARVCVVLLCSVVRLCWAALHCVLCCVLCCINKEWWPRLHGPRPRSSLGAKSWQPPKHLDAAIHPSAGRGPSTRAQPMRIVRISHLILPHVFASVGSMGLGVAPPYAAVMHVALRRAMRLSVTPLCDALYCCAHNAGCVSHCAVCCAVSLCAAVAPRACVLQCSVLLRPRLFVVLHYCDAGRPAWPHRASCFLLPQRVREASTIKRARRSVGNSLPGAGRSLLVSPRLCAPPAATPHVCSTPHAGGSYTAGCTLRWP